MAFVRGTADGDGGGDDTMELAAADQQSDDFYNGWAIVLLEGDGTDGLTVGQRTRVVTDYVNATNHVVVDDDWAEAVGAGTVYLLVED